jgi:hypothetical protein
VVSAEEWVCGHVRPTGPAEVVRDRVWATTSRIPTADGVVWFKAAAESHRFEAELVAQLAGGCVSAGLLSMLFIHNDSLRRALIIIFLILSVTSLVAAVVLLTRERR